MVRPMPFSGKKKVASGLPTRASHASVSSAAPPTAKPLSAATTGTSVSSTARVISWKPAINASKPPRLRSAVASRSSPADKALPVPVSTNPAESPARARMRSPMAGSIAGVRALSLAGRSKRSTATLPARADTRCSPAGSQSRSITGRCYVATPAAPGRGDGVSPQRAPVGNRATWTSRNATVGSDDVLSASLGQVWPTEGGKGEDGDDDDVAAGVGDGAAGGDRLGGRWGGEGGRHRES